MPSPVISTLVDTCSQWFRCRHAGCQWEGVWFAVGEQRQAEQIRESHERHCRHNPENHRMR